MRSFRLEKGEELIRLAAGHGQGRAGGGGMGAGEVVRGWEDAEQGSNSPLTGPQSNVKRDFLSLWRPTNSA